MYLCAMISDQQNAMLPFLFNPWNDLALASNDPHYTPPASARQMASELQPFFTALLSSLTPHPVWGWSPLAVTKLREAGVPAHALPSTEQMAAYRAASSRQTAVCLLQRLRATWPEPFEDGRLVGESRWCQTEDEVQKAVVSFGGTAMLKAPWSGSGRGVKRFQISNPSSLNPHPSPWISRTLRTQGGVEVEPFYDKVQDMAMEFWAENGRVRYEGLSLFETTTAGVYAGNLVASEEEKERRLAPYIDLDLLHELRHHLEVLLSEGIIPAWYTGPLGIDMMVVESIPHSSFAIRHSSYSLHPFLELNLRMTMGWVACRLAQELAKDETAIFRIDTSGGHYKAIFQKGESS